MNTNILRIRESKLTSSYIKNVQRINTKLTSVALALFILIFVSLGFSSERASKYHGQEIEHLLQKYQGMRVELEPNHSRYIQGQFINIRYRVTCEKPCVMPWSNLTISAYLTLLKDGIPVEKMYFGEHTADGSGSDTSLSHEEVAQVNGTYYDKSIRETNGLKYLAAGNYIGYLDDGIVSPDFSFVIEPIPDSLQYRWNQFFKLKRLVERRKRSPDHYDIDSVTVIMKDFMLQPVGSIWRREVLDRGLFLFSLYKDRYDGYKDVPDFQPHEIDFLNNVFIAISDEPDMPSKGIVIHILNSICPSDDKSERAATLVTIAERLGKPEIIQEAQKEASEILALEAKRRENR